MDDVEWDASGCSALQWAALHGRLSAVKMLLDRGANMEFKDPVWLPLSARGARSRAFKGCTLAPLGAHLLTRAAELRFLGSFAS